MTMSNNDDADDDDSDDDNENDDNDEVEDLIDNRKLKQFTTAIGSKKAPKTQCACLEITFHRSAKS